MSSSSDAEIRNVVLLPMFCFMSWLSSFQDENATRDLNEQLDALKAHLDYVQENIAEAQTEIADLAVS
jgi:hypothetical protein